MTKFRSPTPHTPPPTSKRGDVLRVPRNGLPWALRDARGIVHLRNFQGHVPACRHLYNDGQFNAFEDTLADVSCLWCLAGVSFE